MARSPRIERAGAWHHVTARGNERRSIFRDDRDRLHFCEILGQAEGNVRLAAPCLHGSQANRRQNGSGRRAGRRSEIMPKTSPNVKCEGTTPMFLPMGEKNRPKRSG